MSQHVIPKRASRYQPPGTADVQTDALPKPEPEQKGGWCGPILLGVGIFLCLYIAWSDLVVPTATTVSNNFTYGQAHISELTADVGHGGESTFIGLVLQEKAVVIECVGTPTKCSAYTLGTLQEGGAHPILTLQVKDVNHDGKPDLLVGIQGSQSYIALLNTGTGFRLE